ncbi:PadR family transcriptional regulator [Ectobacillus antri]|jgi:PadR family transcriptional regulator PadR|uniref:PadR family transcriptional regulator n=1 Tax=Ectobacillus antri TaxID=2486280 RepID=A0ABT6H7K4_9BACI|nr:PadR family transcriptional regulator [Ectobacillus antri]MDG4657772.1 PadR family transcriptional regulator [Ectobacillus antri]MDG5754838.1 PadR family transcriptional regulator [Ectobacillus antri]
MKIIQEDQWLNQLKKGTFELSVLLILRKHESYGYEIVKKLNQLPFSSISQAAIYPILKRLLEHDLISFYWREIEGKPSRKYYRITEKGEELVFKRLEEYKKVYQSILTLEKEV